MKNNIGAYLGLVLLFIGIYILGFYTSQSEFIKIFAGFTISFSGYALIIFMKQSVKMIDMIIIGCITISQLFFIPNLSDDLYRFIWDGYSILAGINPYMYTPSQLVGEHYGLTSELFKSLNSPDYYSIYPTISQAFFWITVLIGDDLYLQSLILKSIYLLLHFIGAWCLIKLFKKNNWNTSSLLFYYANPLVIVEGIGNLHAEINMVSSLFIALYFWDKRKDWISAAWFTIAIFIKIIPVLLLPYFLLRINKSRYKYYLVKICLLSILFAVPVAIGVLQGGFLNSIDLYFRKFEFNASIYYILRWAGIQLSGYNLIRYLGPFLMLIFLFVNILRLFKTNEEDNQHTFIVYAMFVLTSYLFCATIIHPWYIIGLVALSIFLPKAYILAWSFLVTLTYINYNGGQYYENLWVVSFEYLIVFLLLFTNLQPRLIKRLTLD